MKKIEWLIRYSMLMVSSAVVLGEQYHRRNAAMAGDYMDEIDSENGAYLGSSFMSNMTSASRNLSAVAADMGIFPMSSIDQNDTDQSANRTKEYKTSVALFVFLSILYGAISFVSVTGNCLIIFVVLRNKKMKNVTNYFISNLALADVVIGMFATPFQFQAAHLQRWIFPAIMCKIVPFASTLSVNVSIITLVAISLDRYYVILYPFKQKLSVKKCIIILVGIWIVSILMSLVKLINFGIRTGPNGYPVCTPLIDKVDTIETIVLAITQYIVPFFIISFTYFRIGYHIYFDDTPESVTYNHCKNKRKVIKMIFIVVILFMICWAPIQFFNVFNVIFSDIIDTIPDIHIVWFFSNSLAVSNSCYNVFIYGACSARFKSEFKKLFRCLPCIEDDLCDFDSNARKFTYRNSCNSNMLPSTFGMTPGGGMLAHKKYSCDVTMHRNSMCAPPSNRHSSSFNERFLTRNNFKAKYLSVQNAQANTNKVTNNRASICIKEFDSKTKRTSRIDEL